LRAYNAAKCYCGRACVPDPAGELTALPQTSIAGFSSEGEEGKRKAREGREGKGSREVETGPPIG